MVENILKSLILQAFTQNLKKKKHSEIRHLIKILKNETFFTDFQTLCRKRESLS